MGGFRGTDPDTCRRAYEQMKDDGSLSKRRLEAIATLSEATRPPTVGEMALQMNTNRNNLATRMSELEHLGVVYKAEERECLVSEKECWTWWMTGKQPEGEIPRGINTNEILRGQRDRAMGQVEDLETLCRKVAAYLEAPEQNYKNDRRYERAGKRLRERLSKIVGEKL